MNVDRQGIERRDFPISRRGYDTAAVDAHLQALAGEFEELQRSAAAGGDASLAATAGSKVQSIIQAAETAAAEIERQALEDARSAREEADRDARRTRDDAVARARAHVAAVGELAAALLERVGSMDKELSALVETLRAGGRRLSADLSAIEQNMSYLYDAASGQPVASAGASGAAGGPAQASAAGASAEGDAAAASPPAEAAGKATAAEAPERDGPDRSLPAAAARADAKAPAGAAPGAAASGDLDGARLVALNMALNGESRADTDRYLAENFELVDRPKLLDEVYAAIEG